MNKQYSVNEIQGLLTQAFALHQEGQFVQARLLYQKILKAVPDCYDALHHLGILAAQMGLLDEAVSLLTKAISIKNNDEKAFNNLGLVFQTLGRYAEALENFERAIALNSEYLEAHFNRGNVLQGMGSYDIALEAYKRAIEIKPDYVDAYNNRANALHELNRVDEALESYNQAIAIWPSYVEALYNKSLLLHEMGMSEAALEACRIAFGIEPKSPEIQNTLGVLLEASGQFNAALIAYDNAIQLDGAYPEAYFNKAHLLQEQKQYEAALKNYDQAIALRPNYAEVYNNRGNLLQEQKQYEGALKNYDEAIALRPNYAEAYFNRGNTFFRLGLQDKARKDYLSALSISPDYVESRWALAISVIPLINSGKDDVENNRLQFERELVELNNWFYGARLESGFKAIGSRQPFYLAYQEENNKELLGQYGQICNRIMQSWFEAKGFEPRKIDDLPSKKIKVGIVSNHIHDHSVWNAIIKGWVTKLDSNKFELSIYYLGLTNDDETNIAQANVAHFFQGARSIDDWVSLILEGGMEALIYPEIGMDQKTLQLASLRLAPLQLASWGHPETTGLQTIDYYLSAQLLESDDAQNNYVEKLIRLPNLGCYYDPLVVSETSIDEKKLKLTPEVPILICPGVPYKYLEKYDWVLIEIARQLGKCQFIFFTQPQWGGFELENRLRNGFVSAGLRFDEYVKFIPWLSRSEFFWLMKKATVCLDTLGFSGFNTAMQAIECGLPIVTRRSAFMRGMLASGPLELLGLSELIADDALGYIDRVLKLAHEPAYRVDIREKIIDRRQALFRDMSAIHGLEHFLTEKLRTN